MQVQKIYVNKEDEVALVVLRVVKAETTDVLLCIPKFSTFGKSLQNFRLLKSEGEALGKTIRVESVDEDVVALAHQCDIEAINPFFQKSTGAFADIVVRHRVVEEKKSIVPPAPKIEATLVNKEEPLVVHEYQEAIPEEPTPKAFPFKKMMLAVFVIAFGGACTFVALRVLPKADITLVTQKKTFTYASAIVVDKNIRTVDSVTMKIPGQLFIEKKNTSLTFPATGKKFIEKKAEGKIVIANAYSSEQQKLVQKTRFVTDAGLIVRLKEPVVVPGAKIVDGKIVPSAIEVAIVADKPGVEYNLAAGTRLTIPGLKGTPKYDGFYGETKVALGGGFVGERAYPTDDDIAKSKSAVAVAIESSAKATALQKIPADFKAIDNGVQFRITKQMVNTDVNEAGMFTVFGEGEMSVMAFRESDVLQALAERSAKEIGQTYIKKSAELNYGIPKLDLTLGKMSLPIDYKSVLAPMIKIDELKGRIMSTSERELKALLLAMPGLESATVALWPFWVRSVPDGNDKIMVNVE